MDIIADILSVLEHRGQNKTVIMRKANLNFKRVNIYIDFLLSKGLVSVSRSSSSKKYFITKSGLELLRDYMKLKESEDMLIKTLRRLKVGLNLGRA